MIATASPMPPDRSGPSVTMLSSELANTQRDLGQARDHIRDLERVAKRLTDDEKALGAALADKIELEPDFDRWNPVNNFVVIDLDEDAGLINCIPLSIDVYVAAPDGSDHRFHCTLKLPQCSGNNLYYEID